MITKGNDYRRSRGLHCTVIRLLSLGEEIWSVFFSGNGRVEVADLKTGKGMVVMKQWLCRLTVVRIANRH